MREAIVCAAMMALLGLAPKAWANDSDTERVSLTGLTTVSVVVEELSDVARKSGLVGSTLRDQQPGECELVVLGQVGRRIGRRDTALAGLSCLKRHAEPLKHRHAEIVPMGKVFDQTIRTTPIAICMKDDARLKLEIDRCRI